MFRMNPIPCSHLDEEKLCCRIGRQFPNNCLYCAAYLPGATKTEIDRYIAWDQAISSGTGIFVDVPGDANIQTKIGTDASSSAASRNTGCRSKQGL